MMQFFKPSCRQGLPDQSAGSGLAFLQKVADKVGDLDEANASIVAARLALVGQCRDEAAMEVNAYLKEMTR